MIEYDEIEITSLIHYYIPKEYNEIMNKLFKNVDISKFKEVPIKVNKSEFYSMKWLSSGRIGFY